MTQLVSSRLASQLHRRTAAHAYTDAGYYILPADPDVTDEYGQPTASGSSVSVACSFTDKPKMERWRADVEIQEIDAEVRFATPAPTKGGTFKITKRFGSSVTEQKFEIVGIQDRGPFGFVCALKAVVV